MRQVETATVMSILMQGMSFIELGQEFDRTKLPCYRRKWRVTPADRERAMNSYNAPDSANPGEAAHEKRHSSDR